MIYVDANKYPEVKQIKTVEEFVYWYYDNHNPATYHNETCRFNQLQCMAGCNRSFGDMLELCATYFPGTTEEDLAYIWKDLCIKGRLNTFCCPDINRIVSYFEFLEEDEYTPEEIKNFDWQSANWNSSIFDCYGYDNYYEDDYSIEAIKEFAEIKQKKKQKELEKQN